mmetsp:Transcript_38296/g.61474  ORF Transcript_38296/g.61474 Transcript_38296/m.61474 type:complete len:250 (-) Transcript_38296:214-963(-)
MIIKIVDLSNLNGHKHGATSSKGDGIAGHRIKIFSKKSGDISRTTFFHSKSLQDVNITTVLVDTFDFTNRYAETNKDLVATGKLLNVKGTVLDLRAFTLLRRRLKEMRGDKATNGGFDHTYLIDDKLSKNAMLKAKLGNDTKIRLAAELAAGKNGDRINGRRMRVYTDRQAIHLYTGNFLNNNPGKGGVKYKKYGGLCLEAEDLPNAINLQYKKTAHEAFKRPIIVGPNTKPYSSTIIFEFLKDQLVLP